MDIATISTEDLRTLLAQIPGELKSREAQERTRLLTELQTLAKSRGYTIEDLLGKHPTASSKKRDRVASAGGSVTPKYANPADPSMTWTGRGRQPAWIKQLITEGRTLDELLIPAEKP